MFDYQDIFVTFVCEIILVLCWVGTRGYVFNPKAGLRMLGWFDPVWVDTRSSALVWKRRKRFCVCRYHFTHPHMTVICLEKLIERVCPFLTQRWAVFIPAYLWVYDWSKTIVLNKRTRTGISCCAHIAPEVCVCVWVSLKVSEW